MHLVQLLLPTYDNDGKPFVDAYYSGVRRELTDKFGGLTAYTRAPAQGLWKNEGDTTHDDIVVFEIMTANLDRDWWRHYRMGLQELFRQDHLIVRAQAVMIL
jgi:hypothetical protein